MSWMTRSLYTCQDMSRLLSDVMDQSLPWHVRLRMRAHLHICALCRRYEQQLTLIRAVLRKNSATLNDKDRPTPSSLSPEAKARIQQALDSRRP